MSTWLHRIGTFSARNRRLVLAAWILLTVGALLLNRTVGGDAVDNFEVPGVESQAATDLLKERFPERAGATAMVVFHTDTGAVTDPAFAAGTAAGMPIDESIGRTNGTAGKAVVIAGSTVVVAILGLQLAGIPFVAALGYSASIVVAIAVTSAVTLLPAFLGFAGTRVLARSHRTQGPAPERGHSAWVRWAHWVAHHPWRSSITATLVLLALAVPVLDMQLGQADAGTAPASTTPRRAYDLLAAGFGAGFNGPLLVTIDLGPTPEPTMIDEITAEVAADPGVQAVSPAQVNTAGDTAIITAIPTTKPQDEATSELVHRLRDTTLPDVTAGSGAAALVGGPTAGFIDQSDKISTRLPWFIAAVVAMSFILLMIVFRSILVPLKAALLNLMSIGAAYGVVVAVFQWGWGRSLIGLDDAVPIASFVPMMMSAILFGLSMDYEVFILSRIREEHHRGHTNIDIEGEPDRAGSPTPATAQAFATGATRDS